MARRDRREQLAICLPTSHGGHLELLAALETSYADRAHMFVTPPSRQADELRDAGHDVVEIANPQRNPLALASNILRAVRVASRQRPRVVLSAGAGAAVPLCLAAKALGARLIFIETMARVQNGSLSGRILYRVADHFLVQWPELVSVYPRAEVCRPALLEDAASHPSCTGRGTFIAAGSHGQPFDRLLRQADAAANVGALPEPILAQARNASYRPRHFELVPTLSPAEVADAMRAHRVIICHGGAGLIALSLRHGRVPLVLPRRRAEGEHVDDHQVPMTAKLADLGLVVSLDETSLESAVSARPPPKTAGEMPGPRLADRVRELIETPK